MRCRPRWSGPVPTPRLRQQGQEAGDGDGHEDPHPDGQTPRLVLGHVRGGGVGRLVHRLVRAGAGLFVAHTNADAAVGGVAQALAEAVGLVDLEPLVALPGEPLDKHVVFVPEADADALVDALAAAGAGRIGEYSRAAWTTSGTARRWSVATPR